MGSRGKEKTGVDRFSVVAFVLIHEVLRSVQIPLCSFPSSLALQTSRKIQAFAL